MTSQIFDTVYTLLLTSTSAFHSFLW